LAQSPEEHLTAGCCENASGNHTLKFEVACKAKKQDCLGMKAASCS
jgi:hypothetical protein